MVVYHEDILIADVVGPVAVLFVDVLVAVALFCFFTMYFSPIICCCMSHIFFLSLHM